MTYREWSTPLPGAVLWSRAPTAEASTVLPDGCLDLIWVGGALIVAGPDTAARTVRPAAGTRYVGLRLAEGLGPRLLGVPADALRDATPPLADIWGARRADALAARVADDPARELVRLLSRDLAADPFGARVARGLDAGLSVAAVADRLGVTVRTLHRRCGPTFGYGPQHLARILRLQRALAAARRGRPWAEVAAATGYADQPHLARETRALTGTTPTALLGQRSSEANRSIDVPSGSATTA